MEEGERLAIMGPSGSGKTTLMHIIAGIDVPTAGRAVVLGHCISERKEEERVRFRHDHIGIIFQAFHLLPGLTALENVQLILSMKGRDDPKKMAYQILADLGLEHRVHVRVDRLSGGEMQRVGIARAIADKPRILLADEPTAQLDREHASSVMDQLFSLKQTQEMTVVVVTHDDKVADRCDRVISMDDLSA